MDHERTESPEAGKTGVWYEPFRRFDLKADGLLLHAEALRGPPAWRLEYALRPARAGGMFYAVRVSVLGEPVLWIRVDDWWGALRVLVGARRAGDVLPPIRSEHVRAAGDPQAPTWWSHWMRAFARGLADSERSPLHQGRFWLAAVAGGEARTLARPQPSLPAVGFEPQQEVWAPAMFRTDFVGRLVATRPASPEDDGRVKSWRKHAAAGTLPPLLVAYVSVIEAYVILDGHDRLLAAQLEKTRPRVMALSHLRVIPPPPPEERQQTREAVDRQFGVMDHERMSSATRDSVNRMLVDLYSDGGKVEALSRMWPIPGGIAAWQQELRKRLQTLPDSDEARDAARDMLERVRAARRR